MGAGKINAAAVTDFSQKLYGKSAAAQDPARYPSSYPGAHVGAVGGAVTFIELTDTPANYTGDAGKVLRVNAGEDAVEFEGVVTRYATISPANFAIEVGGDLAQFWNDGQYLRAAINPTNQFYLKMDLPDGAVITEIKIFGTIDAGNNVWAAIRSDRAGAKATMAGANDIGTADTSISFATIDNSLYNYYIEASILTAEDRCYGGYAKYTIQR